MKKNILFCGTPEFAIASLKSIYEHQNNLNYKLVGVLTIPNKIAGRGQKTQESAVKKEAKNLGLKIFEPRNLDEPHFINQIKKLNLDLIIVVAFKKLPKILFNIPTIGTINLHASLLPNYRGAAPINWVIINGEKETGLTTFFINENIDTGDIILQSRISIDENWNAGDLHNKLMEQSNLIMYNTIKVITQGSYTTIKQNTQLNQQLKYAPKITKHDRLIDKSFWTNKTLEEIYNFIRGMSPPGIKTSIIIYQKNITQIKSKKKTSVKNIIITKVGNYIKKKTESCLQKNSNIYICSTDTNQIVITNNIASFNIEKLKIENGKEITAKEFYNGFLKNKNNINKMSFKDI